MQEADALGEAAFLSKYGFSPTARIRIRHAGRTYASKAILGAAHGVQFPEQGPLRPSEFSGGRVTVAKLQQLGFELDPVPASADPLGVALARFLDAYKAASSRKFGHDDPAAQAIKECAALVSSLLPQSLRDANVQASVGQGNWAAVPWIAVLHPSVTTSTQHGVYPVLLFHEDLDAVEITIAQGVTDLKAALGRREAVQELDRRAVRLRPHLSALAARGFAADSDYSLGSSPRARDYVASTVVHHPIRREELADSDVSEDVSALLTAYASLMEDGSLEGSQEGETLVDGPARHALLIYVGQGADGNFESGGRQGWWGWKDSPGGLEALRPGDLVVFGRGGRPRVSLTDWTAQTLREVVVGRITSIPERTDFRVMPDELSGDASYPWKFRFEHVASEREVDLAPGVNLSEFAADALRRSGSVRGIGVLVPITGSPMLEKYVNGAAAAGTPSQIAAAAAQFVEAVEESGLRLNQTELRAFLAALMTKPFAILTGQSGSGKTQLAKRLGEWFGTDSSGRPRYLPVPVRPDWTGPEFLFGYEDALRSTASHRVWSVPDALEFMLRAVSEPEAPYLLLLDEMNLAHVERYFADFLSGLESRDQVLPELIDVDGDWVVSGRGQRLPLPRNLYVVGTVNVDETTYLFSPKVLDRAFVFEFRTAVEDLDPTMRRPVPIAPAEHPVRRLFVDVTTDDAWQLENPHDDLEALVDGLRELHGLLQSSGHEFGHRVFYESLRFAALLRATGITDRWAALDRIALAKLLPRINGTRARVEQPLVNLIRFARPDGDAEPARLPLTATKAERMLGVLREAQFVSFTD